MNDLVPCRKCKQQVEKKAKKCPLCGVASPAAKSSDIAKGCLSMIVLLIVIGFVLKSCIGGSDESETKLQKDTQTSLSINTELAQKYVILDTQTYATPPNKLGLKFVIYSENADTFEKRGQTLLKAAYDLLDGRELYEVVVRLSALPSMKPDYIYAGQVTYSPHKRDTWGNEQKFVWDVTASPNSVVNGQIEEDGKYYPLTYMTVKLYLKK
jgi:hypothetical protein